MVPTIGLDRIDLLDLLHCLCYLCRAADTSQFPVGYSGHKVRVLLWQLLYSYTSSFKSFQLYRLLLDTTGDAKSVRLYWAQLALTIVAVNTAGRLLIPVVHTIITATAMVRAHDGTADVSQAQVHVLLSFNVLAASSTWFAFLRFSEVIYAESQELQSHKLLMRGRSELWKSRLLQRIVGNRVCGMPLAVRRGDIDIIQTGVAAEVLQIVIENVVTLSLLVNADRPVFLLGKG